MLPQPTGTSGALDHMKAVLKVQYYFADGRRATGLSFEA